MGDNLFEISALKSPLLEISSTQANGRRTIKFVAHTIHSDGEWNENGLTFLEEYTRNNLNSAHGMSITAQLSNREIPINHGYTGMSEDGLPIFEDAYVVGHVESASIRKVIVNGAEVNAMVCVGSLDEMRFPKFIAWLQESFATGNTISGSVEISAKTRGEPIIYDGGYKEFGRKAQVFDYTGFSIITVKPADDQSLVLELNSAKSQPNNNFDNLRKKVSELNTKKKSNKKQLEVNNVKEEPKLNEEMKKLLEAFKADIITEINNALKSTVEVNDLKEQLDKANVTVATLQSQLKQVEDEEDNLKTALKVCEEKEEELIKAIAEKELENRLMALNSALSQEGFTEDDKKLASDLIDKFNADPKSVEVNSIVDKIQAAKYKEVSEKLAKIEKEKEVTHEENSLRFPSLDNIFGSVENFTPKTTETGSLF